jgi:glycosyltransferase involved in cell wall biosynthesis
MRILHAPMNIAGQATMISRAQRELGHISDVLVAKQEVWNYECDFNLEIDKKGILGQILIVLKYFFFALRTYDIFHFHLAYSFFPYNLDLYILRLFGKKVVMQYWGSDIIQVPIAKEYTLLTGEDLKSVSSRQDDEKIKKKIKRIHSVANLTLVGDYSLLPYAPLCKVSRQAFDISRIPYIGCEQSEHRIKIIHAPTNRKIKGTDYIVKIINRLQEEGFDIELRIIEKTPNEIALQLYRDADIAIDDILQGPYGIFAIECMCMGKPVMGRIDPKLLNYYSDLPILNTNPQNLYENLITLIKDKALRCALGKKGREYVEMNHNSKMIANNLLNLYSRL